MTTTRRPPWYQREPYPSIVGKLLDAELLTEGGTAALKLAARLAERARKAKPGEASEMVTDQLGLELLAGALRPGPIAPRRLIEAGCDVVDILVEHGELLT